ncbi:hypothetical protein FKK32_30345, partial [Klebsiella pneumoniae]|nr:hypothetical protein [Klebsiella pneumoniae]
DTQPTLGFQRVIQRAIMHVQSTGNGKKEVTGANVLVAIFEFNAPRNQKSKLTGELRGSELWMADLGPSAGARPGK